MLESAERKTWPGIVGTQMPGARTGKPGVALMPRSVR